MAIDFDLAPEDQEQEPTGPILERPEHFEDPEIDDEDAFQEVEDPAALAEALAEPVDADAEEVQD